MDQLEQAPFTFDEVKKLHSMFSQADPFFAGMGLKDFSRLSNEMTASKNFSAGDVGMLGRGIKEYGSFVDRAIQPVNKAVGSLTGSLGALVGPKTEEAFRSAGEAVPRLGAQILATRIPYVGFPLAIADMMAKTYTDTGSPLASIISGATLPAVAGIPGVMPGAMSVGRGAVANALTKYGPQLSRLIKAPAEYAGAQLGGMAAAEGIGQLTSAAAAHSQGQPWSAGFYNPFEPKRLGESLALQGLFGIMDLPSLKGVKAGPHGTEPLGWKDLFKSEKDIPGFSPTFSDAQLEAKLLEDITLKDRAKAGSSTSQTREETEKPITVRADDQKTVKAPTTVVEDEVKTPTTPTSSKVKVPGEPESVPVKQKNGSIIDQFTLPLDQSKTASDPFAEIVSDAAKMTPEQRAKASWVVKWTEKDGKNRQEVFPDPDRAVRLAGELKAEGKIVGVQQMVSDLSSHGAEAKLPEPTKVDLQKVITPEMEEELMALGHFQTEIKKMSFDQAQQILGKTKEVIPSGKETQGQEVLGFNQGDIVTLKGKSGRFGQVLKAEKQADGSVIVEVQHEDGNKAMYRPDKLTKVVERPKIIKGDFDVIESPLQPNTFGVQDTETGQISGKFYKTREEAQGEASKLNLLHSGAPEVDVVRVKWKSADGHDMWKDFPKTDSGKGLAIEFADSLHEKGLEVERPEFAKGKVKPSLNAMESGEKLSDSAWKKTVIEELNRAQREGRSKDEMARIYNFWKNSAPTGEAKDWISNLSREVGLDEALVKKPEGLLQATQRFFNGYFAAQGENPERARILSNAATRVAARFLGSMEGKVNFGQLLSNERGMHLALTENVTSPVLRHIVAVRETTGPRSTRAFEALFVLAHELSHGMFAESARDINSPQYREYLRAITSASKMTSLEKVETIRQMTRMLTPVELMSSVELQGKAAYEKINGDEEFLSDFSALLAMGAEKPGTAKELNAMMQFGNRETQRFMQGLFRDFATVWGAFKEFLGLAERNLGPLKNVRKEVEEIYDSLTKMIRTAEEADTDVQAFMALAERKMRTPFDPPPLVTTSELQRLMNRHTREKNVVCEVLGIEPSDTGPVVQAMEAATEIVHPEEIGGFRRKFFDFLKPMAQFVEGIKKKVPSAVDVFSLGVRYPQFVNNNVMEVWTRVWRNEKGEMDWKRLRWIGSEGTKQNSAFNKIALRENERSVAGEDTFMTRAEREALSPEYKSLSMIEKDKVDLCIEQFGEMSKITGEEEIRTRRLMTNNLAAITIQSHNKNMFSPEATKWGQEAVSLVYDRNNPRVFANEQEWALSAQEFFKKVPLSDETKKSLFKDLEKNYEDYTKLQDHLLGKADDSGERSGKLFYMPEVRYLPWHIAYGLATDLDAKGKPKVHLEHFKSRQEAATRVAGLRKEGGVEWMMHYNRMDKAERFQGLIKERLVDVYAAADKQYMDNVLYNIEKSMPGSETVVDAVREGYVPGTGARWIRTSPYMRERKFTAGREHINLVEGYVHYVDAVAHKHAKGFVTQGSHLVLNNPDMRANLNIRNRFSDWLNFVTNPEGKEWTAMKNLIFFNYMGLNPSTLLVESTQQMLTVVPGLIREGMSLSKVYRSLVDAQVEMGKAWKNGKKYENEDLNWAVAEAVRNDIIKTGFQSDLYGETDFDYAKIRSSVAGDNKLGEARDALLRKPLYQMMAAARHFYGYSTRFNSQATFIAAFKHAMETTAKGDRQKAYDWASHFTYVTLFGGGRVTRPEVFQGMGKWTGVGGLLYSLNSYTFNTIAMMARLGKEAIIRQPGLSASERSSAQKAFATMMGTQALFAGLLGYPLVAGTVALIEQIFGVPVKKELREAFVNLAGDDAELGRMIADGALNGALNTGPLDIGSRFQLGNLLGVSAYDGFSWKNLLGPAASMLENYGKAANAVVEGDGWTALEKIAPTGIRNILKTVEAGGDSRDTQDRMVHKMDDTDAVLQALGFKPKAVNQYYERQAMYLRSETNRQKELGGFKKEIAKLLLNGNYKEAQKALYAGKAEYGDYDVREMLKGAIEYAQEYKYPRDPLASASRYNLTDAQEIQRLFPSVEGPSESAKLMEKMQMERAVGVPFMGMPTREEMMKAQMVDQYLKQNPQMTIAQAKRAIELKMHPQNIVRQGVQPGTLQSLLVR